MKDIDFIKFREGYLNRQANFKICELHEIMKKCHIDLYHGTRNCVQYNEGRDTFEIEINENDPLVDPYLALKHEIFHVLFDSPLKTLKDELDKISENIPERYKKMSKSLVHSVANILEDQRIESLGGELYIGDKIRIIEMRKRLGNVLTKPENPVDALLAARFFRDTGKWSIAEKYIKDVEHTSVNCGIMLTKKYIDEVIIPWLLTQIIVDTNEQEKQKHGDNNEQSKEQNKEQNEDDDSENNTDEQGEDNGFEDDKEDIPDNKKVKKRIKQNTNEIEFERRMDELSSETINIEMGDKSEPMNWAKSLEDYKKEGLITLQEMKTIVDKQKMLSKLVERNFECFKKEPDNIHTTEKIDINQNLAERLKRILQKLQNGKTDTFDTEGQEIDVDRVIDYKITGDSEIFRNDKPATGANIVVSVDMSGSMESRIKHIKNVCGTIMYALKDQNQITLTIQGWSDHSEGVSIYTAKNLNDLEKLPSTYGSTPMGGGIAAARKHLESQNQSNARVLIVVTDGEPNHVVSVMTRDCRDVPNMAVEECKFQVQKCLRNGIIVFGIGINVGQSENMNSIFEKSWVDCYNINEASEELMKKLKTVIMRYA